MVLRDGSSERFFGMAAWIKAVALSSGSPNAKVRWMDRSPLGGFEIWQTVRGVLRGATDRSVGKIAGFTQAIGFAQRSDRLATWSRRQAGLTRGCVWIGWTELLWRRAFGSAAVSERSMQ